MTSIPLEELEAQAPFLRRLARALVRDEDAAADLVQETWLAALRHGPREGEEARGWLARLLRTRARSTRRGDARRSARERSAARGGGGRAGGGTEVAERVLAAVLALEEPGKSAILRRYYEDLAPSVIAERTGTPLKTVEARLARARAELRRRLDGDFGGRASWGVALTALAGLESPARLTSGGLLLAAAGLCGVAVVGWRSWRAPEAAPSAPAPLIAADVAPPPAQVMAQLAEPPAAAQPEREPQPVASAAQPPQLPAEKLDAGLLAEEAALVTGRVEGAGLIAPWVAVVVQSEDKQGVTVVAARPVDPNGTYAVKVELKGRGSAFQLVAVAEERVPVARKLKLAPGRTREEVLQLWDAGAVAAGYLVEPSSATLPGATVRLWQPLAYCRLTVGPYELAFDGGFALRTRDVVADRYGRFEAFGFSPGPHRAAVLAPAEPEVETLHLLEPYGGTPVDLPDPRLALTCGFDLLRIEIQGPAGPVDGIALFHGERDKMEQLLVELDALDRWGFSPRKRNAPEPGGHLGVPKSGRLRLAFERRDKPLVLFRRAGFKTLVLELADAAPGPDGWLSLRLEPTLEQPVLELAVDVQGEAPAAFELVLASTGTGLAWSPAIQRVLPFAQPLRVHDVGPGKYALELKPIGPSPFVPLHAEIEVRPEDKRTQVALAPVRGAIASLVARNGAASPAGLELVLERGAGERLVCVPLDAGELKPGERAELAPRVPPGTWRVRLLAAGTVLWRGDVKVEPGGDLDVPLDPR